MSYFKEGKIKIIAISKQDITCFFVRLGTKTTRLRKYHPNFSTF